MNISLLEMASAYATIIENDDIDIEIEEPINCPEKKYK